MTALAILLIAVVVILVAGKRKGKPRAHAGWRILYSTGFPDAPTPQGDGAIGPEFLEAT